jgi:hypothetical protein
MIASPANNREKSPFSSSSSPISPNVAGSHSLNVMNHLMRRKSPFTRPIPPDDEKKDDNKIDDKKTEETSSKPSIIKVSESKTPPEKIRNPTPTQTIMYHLAAKSPSAVHSSDSPSKLKSMPSSDSDDKPRSPQVASPTNNDDSDDSKSKKIYEAASRGDFLSLCKSIEDDVNCVGVNYKGGYGLTALIISAEKGQVVALRMLIRAGSDVNATSNWGTTAGFSMHCSCGEILQLSKCKL